MLHDLFTIEIIGKLQGGLNNFEHNCILQIQLNIWLKNACEKGQFFFFDYLVELAFYRTYYHLSSNAVYLYRESILFRIEKISTCLYIKFN